MLDWGRALLEAPPELLDALFIGQQAVAKLDSRPFERSSERWSQRFVTAITSTL
jgi:hypothetical protein